MKACLIFQRRFTIVAHKVAIELKKNHGVNEFCGYVYLNKAAAFLRKQGDIDYGTLLVDEEIHDKSAREKLDWDYLETLEREYGIPNLWPYLTVDRVIRYGMGVREYPHDTSPYTHEDMARMLQTTAREIIAFLEREKPDFIYMLAVGALGLKLLYYIAKKKGITVIVGSETRIEGGYAFSEDYRTFSFAERRFMELMRGAQSPSEADAKKWLYDFRQKPSSYSFLVGDYKKSGSRLEAYSWLTPWKLARSFGWLSERIARTMRTKRDYLEQSPWWFLVDAMRRKFRLIRGYSDLYDVYDPREQFVYYPLHLEPEIAMLVFAPRWTDQANLIKQIAESLPLSFKLYVKEHPAMVGFRTRQYYRELKKIPNVKLIHPNHDSYTIINDARIITTVTGTTGWEALMLKKPVITFGDIYYNALSMVKKCTEIEGLPYLVKEQLENFTFNESELVHFVSALLEDSKNIKLNELWEKGLDTASEQRSVSGLCTLLMEKVQNMKSA